MPIRRNYADHGDACAAAHALDVVGDRWSIIVIRELTLGPKRFAELLAGARGATPTVLTTRLRELELVGIVEKLELPPPARVNVYGLTPWGQEFEPVLQALGRWAQRGPFPLPAGGLTPDAAVLAMSTMAGDPPPRTPTRLALGLRDQRDTRPQTTWYQIRWGPGPLTAQKLSDRVEPADGVACDSSLWADLLFGGQQIGATLASAAVSTHGRGRLTAHAFLTHFRRTTQFAG